MLARARGVCHSSLHNLIKLQIHHREAKRMKEIEAERAEKLAANLHLFGLERGAASSSHGEHWECSGSRFTPIDRRDAIESQHRRHDLAADAARAHGAPLLSAEVEGRYQS